MTTSTRSLEPVRTGDRADLVEHRHVTRCWWDLHQCRWRCPADSAGVAPRDLVAPDDEGC